eukprot:UN06995
MEMSRCLRRKRCCDATQDFAFYLKMLHLTKTMTRTTSTLAQTNSLTKTGASPNLSRLCRIQNKAND